MSNEATINNNIDKMFMQGLGYGKFTAGASPKLGQPLFKPQRTSDQKYVNMDAGRIILSSVPTICLSVGLTNIILRKFYSKT